MAEETMELVEVACEGTLNYSGMYYAKGAVLEMEAKHARRSFAEGTVRPARPGSPITQGVPRDTDAVEEFVRAGDFEKAKQAAAAAGMVAPPASADPRDPIPAAVGTGVQVNPIGDFSGQAAGNSEG